MDEFKEIISNKMINKAINITVSVCIKHTDAFLFFIV